MYLLNNVTGINFCTEQWFSTWCTHIRVQVSGLLGISEKISIMAKITKRVNKIAKS